MVPSEQVRGSVVQAQVPLEQSGINLDGCVKRSEVSSGPTLSARVTDDSRKSEPSSLSQVGFCNTGPVRLAGRGFAVKFVCRAAVLAIEAARLDQSWCG